MAMLVAYRMELQPRRGQSTAEMVDDICDHFSEFVVKHFRRHGVEIFPLHFDGKPDCLDKDNRLVATRFKSEQHTLATVDWEVIPDQGSDHVWRISLACSCDKHTVEIQYHGHLDLSTLLVTPGKKKMKIDPGLLTPDELLSRVLGRWVATVDGWSVPVAVSLLKANSVKAFVEDTLLNPKRVLPVIVLAADGRFKATPSSMQDLQRRLLGVAHVAALMNKQATASLQAELGAERACSVGVLRIYYPMFTRECPPRNHPLFRAEELRGTATDFEAFLHRESMNFLVRRSPDGPLTKAARSAVAAEMFKLVDRYQTLQSHLVTAESKLHSVEGQRDRIKDERDELRSSLRSVESKLSERNRKLGNQSDELAVMRAKYETCARELAMRGGELQIAIERECEQNRIIAELENRLEHLRDEIRTGNAKPSDAGETHEELQRAWQENDRTLTDLEAARHEIARMHVELRVCKENLEMIVANPTGIRKLPDDTPSAGKGGSRRRQSLKLSIWHRSDMQTLSRYGTTPGVRRRNPTILDRRESWKPWTPLPKLVVVFLMQRRPDIQLARSNKHSGRKSRSNMRRERAR